MKIFEYPFIIITILVAGFILMGLVGLYFTLKAVKTANGTVKKDFCGIGKLESEFNDGAQKRKNRCVIYVSVVLDNMERLHQQTKTSRIYEQIKKVLFLHFCIINDGDISLYGSNNFVALNLLSADEIPSFLDVCYEDISKVLTQHGAMNIVHINFGYHLTSATDVPFQTALIRAKQACSRAEDKDVLYFRWDSVNGKEFERKIKIENSIQNEIDNNRFFLEYQPLLDAKTGEIIGAEVLSRLNSEADGILTPNMFLSAVKNVGLNEKFDYYIFEKNCKWIANDKETRSKYVYTINFSRSTLCDENFADNLISIVEKYGCDYSAIAVEILEDKDLSAAEKQVMIKNLLLLKEKGVLILLDDFGKGYTNFGDLAELDISIVKIDKSITQNATNNSGFLILKNIIQTAHDLGFKTLCEGIETNEHRQIVTDAGCDMLQGYYFYRPMPVSKLETLLKN